MEHTSNVLYPNASPAWCGNSMAVSNAINNYDGHMWYSTWLPYSVNFVIWHTQPLIEEMLAGNVCMRSQGNVWICATPASGGPIAGPAVESNVKPMLSVTSVKMENHPEHISVMFGQVISNLK